MVESTKKSKLLRTARDDGSSDEELDNAVKKTDTVTSSEEEDSSSSSSSSNSSSDDSSSSSGDSSSSDTSDSSDSESDGEFSSSSSSDSSDDDTSSDSDNDTSSDDGDDLSSSSDEEEATAGPGPNQWLRQNDDDDKKKKAAEMKTKTKSGAAAASKQPKLTKAQKADAAVAAATRSKEQPLFAEDEKIDPEAVSQKLVELTAFRGRKNYDRTEQIRLLGELAAIGATFGVRCELEVLGHLISAYFDSGLGAFSCMTAAQWVSAYGYVDRALHILRTEKDCYFPFLVPEEGETDDENGDGAAVDSPIGTGVGAGTRTTTALLKAQDAQPGGGEQKARIQTALVMTRFLERLDDELTKALQFTDVHSEEFRSRLGQTVDLLCLLWKGYVHYSKSPLTLQCARNVSLRILESIYYKKDDICMRMWDMVRKRVSPEDGAELDGKDFQASKVLSKLVQENLSYPGADNQVKTRVVLYQSYHEALSGHYYKARSLLSMGNIYEQACTSSTSIQILYNRCLVQLGIAAFRMGLITEAHACLTEICAAGRFKELLAQGLSIQRYVERTPQQERLEKRRLLPYHMHFGGDLVEAVHNICAMLLEVPYMAAYPLDNTKRPIARNFRRLLEAYDRQVFTGPPESPREVILAATKALQRGDWETCSNHIMSLKIWEDMGPDREQVQGIILKRIKEEALRTYLFSFSSLYDSFSVTRLAEMFNLDRDAASSVINKMLIKNSISGSWDEKTECVLIHRVDRTPLQVQALALTERMLKNFD